MFQLRFTLAVLLLTVSAFAEDKKTEVRLDQYGDPLPQGAVARIGTVRFRTGNTVMAVRFSPDGKTLASTGHDGVILWDPRTGKQLRHKEARPSFYRGDFSPDGKKLWLQTYEGAISVWDLSAQPDPGPVPASFKGDHTSFVQPFPAGKLLAVGAKNVVRIWDIATAEVVRELPHENVVSTASVSSDGKLLVSQSGGLVTIWDAKIGKKLSSFPPDPKKDQRGRIRDEDRITGFALSADGRRLATSFERPQSLIRVWEVATGKESSVIPGIDFPERRMQFSPDGKRLARSSQSGLRVWDMQSGKEVWHWPVQGSQALDLTFSPDGKTLATGHIFIVRLWDAATGKEQLPAPEEPTDMEFVWLSPDGRTVVTAGQSYNGVPGLNGSLPDVPGVRHRDARTGKQLDNLEHSFPLLAALSTDGKVLAGWVKDKTVVIFAFDTGKTICRIGYAGVPDLCNLSPDGSVLLLGTHTEDRNVPIIKADVKLELWDTKTGKPLSTLPGHKGLLWGRGTFSPDGRRVATLGQQDKTIRVWEIATGKESQQFETGKRGVWRVAFSSDGRILYGSGLDGKVRIWDLSNAKELPPMPDEQLSEKHKTGLYALLLLPDEKTIVTTDTFGSIFFWDVATGKLRLELKAHQSRVSVLALSSDGKTLLTHGATTALVWDVGTVLRKFQ
jgi:WD40 repeat protein